MTCHMYQHRWLVIYVSFPERCWRGFCWLPKGWLLRNEPLLCRFHTQSTEHYNLSLQWVEPLVPGMHNQWQESPSKHRRLFFFPTLILAYEPWKWKIKTAVLMELSWLWCSLFQMWLNPICIHDITRWRCVLPFSSFIEKTENLCFKIYLIYKIHLYNSTNDVEQKAMWNIQPSHIQCVTSRQIKGERSCYMYIYFHPPFSSIANTCMGTRILVRLLLGCLRFILTVCTDTVQCHGSTPTPIKIPKSPSLGTNWELIPPIRSTPLHFLCLLRADDVFLGLDI